MKLALTNFLVLVFFFNSTVLANNNFFMPGDAFFPTSCTQRQIDELIKSPISEHSFVYDSYGAWEGSFCGNAGFTSAHFSELDEAFLKNLKEAYTRIREEYPKKLVEKSNGHSVEMRETNPIRVLFYREDFPYHRERKADEPAVFLGLRYNENWVEQTVKFGHSKERVRMCPMIDSPSAIVACWRDAEAVPPLDLQIPDGFDYRTPPKSEALTPVRITSEVRAIVIPSISLDEYYRMNSGFYAASIEAKYLLAYAVNSKGVEKMEFTHNPWDNDE